MNTYPSTTPLSLTLAGKTECLTALAALIHSDVAADVVVCEFSEEDNTPTLHVNLWRHEGLIDLPQAVADLVVAAEGHWDGGRCYSFQLA